jgi:benzoate-CoA ligase family protein
MPDGFNAADFLLMRHVDEGRGERTALTGPAGTSTYAELAAAARRFASGLRALDVRPEERVLLFTADSPEMVTVLLATIWSGAIAVPVSTMLTAADLADVLVDSRARVLVVGPEFAAVAQEAVVDAVDLRHVVTLPGATVEPPPGVALHAYADVLAGGSDAGGREFRTWEDSPALWLYTSGTTGKPKGAMHRHGSIRAVTETYGAQVLGIRPDDRCYSVAKLFFAYGIGNSLFFPFAVGATSVLEPRRPTPAIVAERLRDDRPTLFFGSPAFFSAILAADLPVEAFATVRLAVSAGEALPGALQQRFTARYGVDILDGIGSTEALHIFLSNRPGDVRPGTTGRAVPGYELRLVDENDVDVSDGAPGTLLVKGPSIATGYWCRDAVSRQVFRGEWLRTGDTYVRSADGYYSCLGRAVDLIKAGGIWVSPAEVETRLLEHPAVLRAVVVGARDAEGLETPVACVVRAPGAAVEADELIEFCKQGLASFKRPRRVLFVDELPTNANGKVQRFRLRALAAAALGTPAQQSGSATPPLPV